ncbi:hypothetical protein [Pseudanabaena sp. UWO310]|uniref:hypothetical protein n=1 Tax=Pseudanabaena sp. UWO310 TaxID=2480795 RepID=UPI001157819C|nr:hypothetical protein [Pseudanabaena sp. UWO310]TYQ31142.1 hypothetical protein PseudUWO310_05200 [Pseudanabaena sp. UWO310]
MNLNTIQQEIATLPPEAQQVIFDLVSVLKNRYHTNQPTSVKNKSQNWSDFIGCMEAEPDLSTNYKTYLSKELDLKYGNR